MNEWLKNDKPLAGQMGDGAYDLKPAGESERVRVLEAALRELSQVAARIVNEVDSPWTAALAVPLNNAAKALAPTLAKPVPYCCTRCGCWGDETLLANCPNCLTTAFLTRVA